MFSYLLLLSILELLKFIFSQTAEPHANVGNDSDFESCTTGDEESELSDVSVNNCKQAVSKLMDAYDHAEAMYKQVCRVIYLVDEVV